MLTQYGGKEPTRRAKAIAALDKVRIAESQARAIIHLAYPIGAEISWEKRGHLQYGKIVHHRTSGAGDAFYVENSMTGKRYWIDYYWVRGPQC